MTFVNLSVRSKASMLYGSADIKNVVSRAKELGQPAVALTDYSNLYDAISFYREATNAGVKPILGVDLFFCEDALEARDQKVRQVTHIVLLAENETGWKNISRLVSMAHSEEYYYYNPRVDFALLEKYKEGVICLSGSSFDGVISSNLYDKKDDAGDVFAPAALFKADGLVRRFLKIYDTDHFFLEVQDHGLADQKIINSRLRNLSKKYGVRTVATNNAHYVEEHDAEAHRTLLEMNQNKFSRATYADFSVEEYYLKSRDDMVILDVTEDELDAALKIADSCNVDIDLKKRRLPKYKFTPDGTSPMDYLRELCVQGMKRLAINPTDGDDFETYQERLDRELSDIDEMGFADYFLIVHDVMSWIRNEGILVGRGRGSAGGSLVSYFLGVTEIDPIEYGLIWERFLNKGRGGLPDIDSDIPRSQRQKVLNYIRKRFGNANVAQIVTLGGLQAKAILKEVFRVYNMPFDEANAITSLVPAKNDEHVAISLQEAIDTVPKLKEYYEQYKPWFKIALSLEGCYKSTGIHAAAVVISDEPFEDSWYPLTRAKDGNMIFGWDMGTVDSLSLLKLDILGLTTLDDIQVASDLVKQRHDIDVSRENMPMDDPKTWAMISQGFTVGLFQIEKQLGRTWSKNLEPSNIEELSDLISIIRPGPMESGMHEYYKKVKHGGEASYIHSMLEPIMSPTYSALLYQEQVIEICKQLAGMSLIDADKVRKAMGKKKPEEMREWKTVFEDGCRESGIEARVADEIWGYIEKFAGYGFNKSHGVGYALLAYETAYLKANYPVEFFCAKLRHAESHPDKFEQMSALVYDAKVFEIEVVPPRASLGNKTFEVIDDNHIAFGLSALKGVGAAAVNDLAKVTKSYDSFSDIIWHVVSSKTKITSAVMNALIKGGAFDDSEEHRVRCLAEYQLLSSLTTNERETVKILISKNPDVDDWVRFVRAIADEERVETVKDKFGVKVPNSRRRIKLREILTEYDQQDIFDSRAQNIAWEHDLLGISLSGSEADVYKSQHKCIDLVKNGYEGMQFEIAVCIDRMHEILTKTKQEPMAFLTVKDDTYMMDNMVVFPRVFQKSKRLLENGNVVKISGKVDDRGSLIANNVTRLK